MKKLLIISFIFLSLISVAQNNKGVYNFDSKDFQISPNPDTKLLKIIPTIDDTLYVTIFDEVRNIYLFTKTHIGKDTIVIPTNHLSVGESYLIKITKNKNVFFRKYIILE